MLDESIRQLQPPGKNVRSRSDVEIIQFAKALFSSSKNQKNKFQDSSSHQILWHMHKVLNIDENKNKLYSLPVNREMNLLILINL